MQATVRATKDVMIEGITADSRQVKRDDMFVAIPGTQRHGNDFIPDAIRSGAAAIVAERGTLQNWDHPQSLVEVQQARLALARIAAALYELQPEQLVAITGTDGKTSTAEFYRQLWSLSGKPAASIGTLGLRSGDALRDLNYPQGLTSPDPVQLYQTLATLKGAGVEHVAMEASSHGLDQFRLDGAQIKAAAFTNFTRDHLDYHGTIERYFAAKQRLFAELLPEGGSAVIHADDARAQDLIALCRGRGHRIVRFGRSAGCDYQIMEQNAHPFGQRVILNLLGEPVTVELPLYGAFQVLNILAAMGLFVAAGGSLEQALRVMPQLEGVPGRLEKVATHASGAPIFVDYAHTPAALENILRTLRPHVSARLHVVFGCGGDRDPGKRAEMGKAANAHADVVIVTDDNPRTENPAAIRQQVLAGASGAKEIADRKEAITHAIQDLHTGDVLVIAGKGHETYQLIGEQKIPFSDSKVAREAAQL